MTNPMENTGTDETESAEEVLAKTAQQVSQQSRTLALHIRQHDDIEAAAQEKADAVVGKLREELGSAYQAALDTTSREIISHQNRQFEERLTRELANFGDRVREIAGEFSSRLHGQIEEMEIADRESQALHDRQMAQVESEIARNRKEGEEQRQSLEKAHDARMTKATEALDRTRAEQDARYEQLCSETIRNTRELLDGALEENSGATDAKLEDHRARVAEEQRTSTAEAIHAVENKRKRSERVLLAIALATAAVAVASFIMAAL